MQVQNKTLKSITIRTSGRSSDYIFPTLVQGCVGACSYCVEEGTLIMTSSGQKKVEEIQDEEEVISFSLETFQFEKDSVTSILQRDTHELYEILTDRGIVRVTGEHPFYTKDRGWVNAEDLTEDDELLYGTLD